MTEPTISASQPNVQQLKIDALSSIATLKIAVDDPSIADFIMHRVKTWVNAELAERDLVLQQATADRKAWLDAINAELAQLRDWANREQKRAELAEGELKQVRGELGRFRTVTDYARRESGSGPGDLQGYIEKLWAERAASAEAREELARLREALNRMCVHFCGQDEELCIECGELIGTEPNCTTCYVIMEAVKALAVPEKPDTP